MRRILASGAVILLALLTSVGAQSPVFRSSVSLVEVDAFATDRNGAFVKDLTADDFEILEDGRPQAVSAFSLVDLPIAPTPKTALLESDVTTNTQSNEGRVWVMVLNAPPISRRTQNIARQFIDEAVGPDDLVAIVPVHGAMHAAQPLTRSKARLFDAIERLNTDASGDLPAGAFAENRRNMDSYRVLEEVSDRLGAALSGRRKAIVWMGATDEREFDLDSALLLAYQEAARAAQRNNVAIYPIEPGGLGYGFPTYRMIADDTGAEAIINTNDFSRGFARMVRDSSTYYVLGYQPTVQRQDGKFHHISVRVKRAGVEVRTRKGYYAERAARRGDQPSRQPVTEMGEVLRNPIPRTALDISVSAVAFKGSSKSCASVLLAAHVRSGDGPRADTRAQIGYRAISSEAETLVDRMKESLVPLTPDGFDVLERVDLPPGRQEIRFATRLPDGTAGSVVTYVDVPDFTSGRVALSGLVVDGPPNTSRTLVIDKAATEHGDGNVTTVRRFKRSSRLTLRSMVYTKNVPDDSLAIDGIVRDEAGVVVLDTSKMAIRTAVVAPGERSATIAYPLAVLPPGGYVFTLRARATSGRRSTAERQLPFWVVAD